MQIGWIFFDQSFSRASPCLGGEEGWEEVVERRGGGGGGFEGWRVLGWGDGQF